MMCSCEWILSRWSCPRYQIIVPVPKPAVHDSELERAGLEYKIQLSFDGAMSR